MFQAAGTACTKGLGLDYVRCRNSEEKAVWWNRVRGRGRRRGQGGEGQVVQGLVGHDMDFLVPRNRKLGLREAVPPVQSHTAAEGQNLDENQSVRFQNLDCQPLPAQLDYFLFPVLLSIQP